MNRPLPLALAAAVVALSAVAGCGGDDADSGPRGYADTIAAVDDICGRAKAASEEASAGADGTAAHDAPIVRKVIEAASEYVDELDDIEPDPKLEAAFDAYVAHIKENQARAGDALEAAESGDDDAYRAVLREMRTRSKETDHLARVLGATGCVG